MGSMVAEKVSISLPEELLARAREAAAERGEPLSLWLRSAVEARLRQYALEAYVRDYEATHGAFTEEELRRADEALGYGSR